MNPQRSFLEAMYTMLFIELFVHDPHIRGDADECAAAALEAARVALETWTQKTEADDNG